MGWLDHVGDDIEDGFEDVEHTVGHVVDEGAHLVGDGLDKVGLHDAADAVDDFGAHAAATLGAQVGEQQLGQSEDPTDLVHGDVKAIGETTGHLQNFATAFGETAHGLQGTDTAHWAGDAAEAFRSKFGDEPPKWARAQQACESAARVWETFGNTVKWAQGQAKEAIELYKQGKQESDQARAEYKHQVDSYNADAKRYNSAIDSGSDPGAKPTPPGSFSDPGQEKIKQAQQMLADARSKRNAAGDEAAQAIKSATELAPKEPSFTDRMLSDGADLLHGGGEGLTHVLGGIAKGAGGIVKFARSLNPTDPYNATHPAEYLDGVSNTAAGLLHGATHPMDLVKGMVGSGWSKDPAEAFGKLIPNIALTVGTDGAGAEAGVAERAGLGAAERSEVGAAEGSTEASASHVADDAPKPTEPPPAHEHPSDSNPPGLHTDLPSRPEIPQHKVDEIVNTPRGERPDPQTYMSQADIDRHLQQFREDGVVRFTPREKFDENGTLGPPGGTYGIPANRFYDVMQRTGGDLGKVETELGLDPGYLSGGDTMAAYIKPENLQNLRMPSGNELGANSQWLPGGYTSGGVPEAAFDTPEGLPFDEIELR